MFCHNISTILTLTKNNTKRYQRSIEGAKPLYPKPLYKKMYSYVVYIYNKKNILSNHTNIINIKYRKSNRTTVPSEH